MKGCSQCGTRRSHPIQAIYRAGLVWVKGAIWCRVGGPGTSEGQPLEHPWYALRVRRLRLRHPFWYILGRVAPLGPSIRSPQPRSRTRY